MRLITVGQANSALIGICFEDRNDVAAIALLSANAPLLTFFS
jgi:hypothetical protein